MKCNRIFSFAMCAVLALSLAACGGNQTAADSGGANRCPGVSAQQRERLAGSHF